MDTSIINFIPEKWRGTVLFLIAVSPYVTRALHALYFGKGLRGALAGIWLGTNSPSKIDPTPTNNGSGEPSSPPAPPAPKL